MFTHSDSLANAVKKDVQEVPNRRVYVPRRVPTSVENFAEVVADPFASRRSLDEDDGERHS